MLRGEGVGDVDGSWGRRQADARRVSMSSLCTTTDRSTSHTFLPHRRHRHRRVSSSGSGSVSEPESASEPATSGRHIREEEGRAKGGTERLSPPSGVGGDGVPPGTEREGEEKEEGSKDGGEGVTAATAVADDETAPPPPTTPPLPPLPRLQLFLFESGRPEIWANNVLQTGYPVPLRHKPGIVGTGKPCLNDSFGAAPPFARDFDVPLRQSSHSVGEQEEEKGGRRAVDAIGFAIVGEENNTDGGGGAAATYGIGRFGEE